MKLRTSLNVLAAALLTIAPSAFAKTVSLDPGHSQIRWVGKKVTGQHNGTVALKSGQVEVDGKSLKGGKFEIDMTSIANEDLKDEEYNTKLTKHLKSDDFFGVEKYPVSTFAITKVKALKGNKDATHEITGDLTIKGVTHPVTFPAKVELNGDSAKAQGKVTVDRTKFNVRYGSGKFFQNLGDKMIYDTFEIDLNLSSKI